MGFIGFLARVALWSVVVLMVLSNLGVNITALVAGLGIGGVAVALAVQNILGDLFASLSIALDRPFVIGDFIIVDDILGTVEYITEGIGFAYPTHTVYLQPADGTGEAP